MPIGPTSQDQTTTQSAIELGKLAHIERTHWTSANRSSADATTSHVAIPNTQPATTPADRHHHLTQRRHDRFERCISHTSPIYTNPASRKTCDHPPLPPFPPLGPIPFSRHIQRTNEEDRRLEQPQPQTQPTPPIKATHAEPDIPNAKPPAHPLSPRLGHIPPAPQATDQQPTTPKLRIRIDQRLPAPGRIDLIG